MHRVVIKVIGDERLELAFNSGDTILNDEEFNLLSLEYPDSFVEIKMSDEEWLRYLSSEVLSIYERAKSLKMIAEELNLDVALPKNSSHRIIALKNKIRDDGVFKLGDEESITSLIEEACSYIDIIRTYERRIFQVVRNRHLTLSHHSFMV